MSEFSIDTSWYEEWLQAFAIYANVGHACDVTGVSREVVLFCRENDPEFAKHWELRRDSAKDRLLLVAWQRALDGSPMMIQMLLKAYFPELFGGARPDTENPETQARPDMLSTDALIARIRARKGQ